MKTDQQLISEMMSQKQVLNRREISNYNSNMNAFDMTRVNIGEMTRGMFSNTMINLSHDPFRQDRP